MKEEVVSNIIIIMFIAIMITFGVVYLWYNESHQNDYCKYEYPSPIDKSSEFSKSWDAKDRFVEEGYIKCCRYVYVEHEAQIECKNFIES